MSIMSKLKSDKKVEGSKKDEGSAQQKQSEQPTNPTRKTWSAGDMRQINRIAERVESSRSKPNTDYYGRKHRSHPRSAASSLRSSRNTSFLGLARVAEDGDDEDTLSPYDIPPMPPMPSKYSSTSLASGSRPRIARSPFSASSSTSKSMLSSAESSPVDSEESSNSSTCSNDVLEMRSHPYSRTEQYVFGKGLGEEHTMYTDPSGKGKAPMYASNASQESQTQQSFPVRPERKYFTKATPTGAAVSDFYDGSRETLTATSTTPKVEAPKSVAAPAKKNRFSFLKKAEVAV